MQLPKSLYEILPFFYILIGMGVILFLESPIAVISGGLLVAAGVLVLQMRRRNRQALAAKNQKQYR